MPDTDVIKNIYHIFLFGKITLANILIGIFASRLMKPHCLFFVGTED